MDSREEQNNVTSLLSFRVLDLTDEKGWFCGKILGDLGADVIKIERPGGDPGRNIGPFYHDLVHSEKSLYWWAFNTSKRGITLNIESRDGQEIFRRLVRNADVVIESFPPGYMGGLGLDYASLTSVNPSLIMTSITPFGQTGPYKDYKASDITLNAMSGFMYICGDPDQPPLRFSVEQSQAHAGLHAALATLVAHYYCGLTGEGQHVDVAMRECFPSEWAQSVWFALKTNPQRTGPFIARHLIKRNIFACKDGHVAFNVWLGSMGQKTYNLIKWMEEEGMAGDMSEVEWSNIEDKNVTQAEIVAWEETIAKFFLTHTKSELVQEAVKRDFMLFPLNTIDDVVHYEQLTERDFWKEVQHNELGISVTYPGSPFRSTEFQWQIFRRAPLIGEHNREVYIDELGFCEDEFLALRQGGII